jgi:hypothetical protein
MIFKELDPFRGDARDVAARLVADRMAYYLRRYYRRSHDIDVLNHLHVPSGNSVARVDHLLLHSHGLLLISRLAGSDGLRIDGDGHWQRLDHGQLVGIGSPITYAYVQGLLLKSFLDRSVQQRGFFDQVEIDVLVVVQDEVDITWPVSGALAEVCKREEVFDRVARRLDQCRASATEPGPLTQTERQLLADFLCRSHRPGA